MMKKRIMAVLLAITMLLSVLNIGTFVSAAQPTTNVVITVLDSDGNNITDSTLSVSVSCTYKLNAFTSFTRSENVNVKKFDPGVFGYDYSKRSNIQYYTINATLTSNGRTYSASERVSPTADSVVITLGDYVRADVWETFDVYYIADGHFPESFYGYGAPEDYGPAGNDTPLLSINVNTTKLRSEFAEDVLYQENVENTYHFIPAKISSNEDEKKAYEENLEYAKAFWEAVKQCMDKPSVDAFKATGLYNTYVVYCLKNQGSASTPDNHADGILSVTPPVYVIEMYDHEGKIFGGYTNDVDTIKNSAVSMNKVLDAYNAHFNQQIEWTDLGNGVWSGSYITETNGRKYRYDLQITQNDIASTTFESSTGIRYKKMTDTYFLAAFTSKTVNIEPVEHIVTYTDGQTDIDSKVFNDQVTAIKTGNPVVEFEGKTDRDNYIFLGWTLQGGDGTVLSQQEILEKYSSVDKDLTFVAVYMVAPSKYNGTVEVILDGYYDTNTATATGQKIDITTVKGNNISLFVKADGTDYIPLEKKATGVYSAQLVNGDYGIYYYDGNNYILTSDQHLNINNEDRTRYIFFEYVDYKLNGGTGGPQPLLEYYDTGAYVKVSDKVPTKQGYIFTGWKDQFETVYQSGSVLSASIGKSYTLTAQWEDAADVFINVTIDHDGKTLGHDITNNKDDISLELVYTPDASIPYIETGDKIVINNQSHPNHSYTFTPEDAADDEAILKTVYTATSPSVTNLSKNYLYSVTVSKHDYNVESIITEKDANGDIIIDVKLVYAPENRDLAFEVRVDENVPQELLPQAAIVKVIAWSNVDNAWDIIVQHKNTIAGRKPGVRVDIDPTTRMGTGTYPVWVDEILQNGTQSPYGYRIIVTALIYPDGTIVETNWSGLKNLEQLKTDLYTIDFGEVSQGKVFGDLNGAYFENNSQIGTLDAVITATGYNVIFDAQGGTVNGQASQTVKNQYKVPSFDDYVPVRAGGYVFDGWYLDSKCTTLATEGVYLNSDITLYAKWRAPLKIEGMITVGATYEQKNEDGSITIQKIHEYDWINSAIVLLQKIEPNGYTDTISQQFVSFNYKDSNYYFEGRTVGHAFYSFDEIADYGYKYRIQVLIPNYNAAFQNEKNNASINNYKDYRSYNHEDFHADFGTIAPTVATVNVHAHFTPQEFELNYSVNAEQIGEGFKPLESEVLVTADGRNTGLLPLNWDVISQMIFGDEYIGKDVAIINGKGQGSNKVWVGRADGMTNYQYGMRIYEVVLANRERVLFSDALPFTVEYKAPAYYMDNAQVGELVATFVPKTYNIIYNTNGGSLSGSYPTEHTWSYETSIAGIVPEFNGFRFDGWYLDKELTQPASDYIDASVAADTTLYAKWIQIMDAVDLYVTIKHSSVNDDGLASNFNKTLYAQLIYADRDDAVSEKNFVDMFGYAKEYPNGQWHTHGDKVREDLFEVPSFYTHLSSEYDYSVDVALEGYYEVEKTVVKTERPDGSTLHTVYVTLQFEPDLFDLKFYVDMADGVPNAVYPQSVEVKVTTWYDDPAVATTWDWYRITQHEFDTVTVNIDPATGHGEGSCSVWHWYDEAKSIPYHYRMEIIGLNFANGNTVLMSEKDTDVSYVGGGYSGKIVVEGGSVPEIENEKQSATTLSGVCAVPHLDSHIQEGTLGAIIDVNKVVFHSNNGESTDDDEFRTYYPSASSSSDGKHYTLNEDGTISAFYEIPEFNYNTHNKYVFKGWYLGVEDDAAPINWSDVYDTTTHIYAHWIETGSVEKEEADNKDTATNTYSGFDLIGVQIRDSAVDTGKHYGTAGSGLRFITVLSEDLYSEINAINGTVAEYGFVLARSSTAIRNAGDAQDYTLQLKGENINGVNTTSSHSYVNNFVCSGVEDHYAGEAYRLYTAVITYNNYSGEELENAYNELYAARSYIRYVDANGLERIYYNNYTGTAFYGGCSTSFAAVRDIVAN